MNKLDDKSVTMNIIYYSSYEINYRYSIRRYLTFFLFFLRNRRKPKSERRSSFFLIYQKKIIKYSYKLHLLILRGSDSLPPWRAFPLKNQRKEQSIIFFLDQKPTCDHVVDCHHVDFDDAVHFKKFIVKIL